MTVHVGGYSYRRVVGSYLRRVPGKTRRVRCYVTTVINVRAYSYELKPRKRSKTKVSRKGPRKVPSKPKAAKPKARPVKAPKPEKPLPSLDKWYNVRDYRESLIAQKEMDGEEVSEVENEIFHNDPDADFINAANLFVWYKPELPRNLALMRRGERLPPFRMVRIWFFVKDNRDDTYKIWCRSSTMDTAEYYADAEEIAIDLFMKVMTDVDEKYDYYEVHDFLGWTAYRLKEATRRDSRAEKKKLGGAE